MVELKNGGTGGPIRKVILFSPHSNEFPALWAVKSELNERLMVEDIRVGFHQITDIPERTRRIRGKFRAGEEELACQVLAIQDHYVRLRAISSLVRKEGDGSVLLELHAYHSPDYQLFFAPPHKRAGWMPIRGTKAVALPDNLDGYVRCIQTFRVSRGFPRAREIAESVGFDIGRAQSKAREIAEEIRTHIGPVMQVEVPGVLKKIGHSHKLFKDYFFPDGRLRQVLLRCEYERCATYLDWDTAAFPRQAISQIASGILSRAARPSYEPQ